MSLTRPVLLGIPSFDANLSNTFSFRVQAGSSQITANQLTIRNQDDNSIVYQSIQNSLKYVHTLPSGTLVNGEYYNATVVVFDVNSDSSPESNPIQFRCYTTPTLDFTNIPIDGFINNASYEFEFRYNQNEGERLNSYVLNLYDANKKIIASSGNNYVVNGEPPYSSTYMFAGFEDGAVYYIELIGETVNGKVIKTDLVKIVIRYTTPSIFTLLTLKNNCEGGFIEVTSNVILVGDEVYPIPPTYISEKEIDLRTVDGAFVDWNQGYKINGDGLARIWFRNPKPHSTILKFTNASGQTITMDYMQGYQNVESLDMQAYVQVTVESIFGMEYYIYSNYIDILSSDKYYNVQLMRQEDIYQVQLIKV